MAYTETKMRNERIYSYRVNSIRLGKSIMKERVYLGVNLPKEELTIKEKETDKKRTQKKVNESIQKIKSIILPILRKNKIKEAGIFGSYARGEQKKNSDVDIIVELGKSMGFEFVSMAEDLEEALHKKVDLLTYQSMHPLLKERILNDEIKIL